MVLTRFAMLLVLSSQVAARTLYNFASCPYSCSCSAVNDDLLVVDCKTSPTSDRLLSEQLHSLLHSNLTYGHLKLTVTGTLLVQRSVCSLTTLIELRLENGLFSHLPDDCFANLTALKMLSAFGNNIKKLQDNVFYGLHKLETLDLSKNRISSIGLQAFAGLQSLKTLDLRQNRISSIGLQVLAGIRELQTLYLSTNFITELQGRLFNGLSNMLILDLSYNRISELRDEFLMDLASCKHCLCSTTAYPRLGYECFQNFPV